MQTGPIIQAAPARSLEELKNRGSDPEAIKAVAREMEALFAYELIKAMRETTSLSSTRGLGQDTYQSMFDMELSKLLAGRGLGLQDMLVQGLSAAAAKAEQAANGRRPQADVESRAATADIATILPEGGAGRVSSGYGLRKDPFTGEQKFHHGLDIPAPEGTEVHPVKQGTVLFSGGQQGYGNVVVIDHGDGFVSKYAHNRENLVKEGDRVDPSSIIARVGSTGRSTGPHVHFEVQYHGEQVDPRIFMAQG